MKAYETEHALIEGLHRNERRANDQLYYGMIHQLCYLIEGVTGDNIIVEDIAAESMVKGFARIKEFRDVASFRYYVFRLARNAAIDYIRSARVRSRVTSDATDHATEVPDDFDREFIYSHAIHVIYQEIAGLPPQVREVITRNLVKGQPLGEVAAEMNLAYKTVHNHRSRGLQLIRLAMMKKRLLEQPLLPVICTILISLAEKNK